MTKSWIAPLLLLGACAANGDLTREKHPVVKTYTSARMPSDVVRCLQKTMPGLSMELGKDAEMVVTSKNQFGTILLAWYVSPASGGSKIEVRRAQSVAPGISRAEGCF